MTTDRALQHDAFAEAIRDRMQTIRRAVPQNLADELVTELRLLRAQAIARRLQEIVDDFWLEPDSDHPRPRIGRVVHSSPFEPPTIIDEPYSDPDEEQA